MKYKCYCNRRYKIILPMKFYDRENEMTALKKYEKLSNKNSQFIVITGRRRIGKTNL